MKSRLLTALAIAVLTVLCAAGTGMANTFGNLVQGPAGGLSIEDQNVCALFTLADNAEVISLTALMTFTGPDDPFAYMIYENNAGDPGDLVACLYGLSPKSGTFYCDLFFDTPIILAPGDYWLGAWADDDGTGGATKVYIATSGGTSQYDATDTYDGSCADPYDVSGTTDASWTVSIYATYRDTDANDIEVIGSSDRSKYFDKAIRAVTVANRCGARMTTVRFSETTALVPDERGVFGITGLDTLLPANATITDCKFKLYVSTNSVNTTDLSAFRSFKPVGFDAVQGTFLTSDTLGMTWNNWKQIDGAVGPDSAWTTAGCGMADDDSTDNRWSGNGGDRKATAEGSTAITGTGWIEIDITNALAQAWYDGTAWENGLLIKNAEAAGDNFVYTKEYNEAQYAPRWYFSYTLPAATDDTPLRRRRLLSGGSQ